MKISQINLRHLRMTLRNPFETSFGRILTRDCILLEAVADGVAGFGECVADRDPGYSYETVDTAWHILRDFLIPAVLNLELQSPKDLQSHLSFVRGHPMAKAGLEMAFWDLLGKHQNRSLREMLGGSRQKVDVGVSVGIQGSPEKLVEVVSGYLEQGYQRVKIKIKPGRDVAETKSVRLAFPQLRLQVDANSAYRLEDALELKPLDNLNLLLIEQPLDEDDLWDHRQLQKELHTPICLDESILSRRHARQAFEMGACKIINIKAGRVGGLNEAVAIHDYCYANHIPAWCGGMLETGVGRASNLALASLPGFSLPGDISASDRYYYEDITEQGFKLNPDSTITVPSEPGLGVSIRIQALARATQAMLKLTS
jgi:O-succinylbenzoate synthase